LREEYKMSNFKSNFLVYWKSNRNVLALYILISIIFLSLNYFVLFGRNLGVDSVLIIIYTVFLPPIMTLITYYGTQLQFYIVLAGRTYWPLLFNIFVPLLINIVFTTVYGIITAYTTGLGLVRSDIYINGIFYLVSVPFIMFTVLGVHEKHYMKNRTLKSAIKPLLIIAFYMIVTVINQYTVNEQLATVIGITAAIIVYYILPSYYMIRLYREVNA
jgi:hypothetical protein